MKTTLLPSLAVTAGRIILGIIFLVHGAQKLFINGMDDVQAGFEAMGAPVPEVSAWLAALAEFIGGGLLIIGLATPLISLILIVDMLGAMIITHWEHGFWIGDGGYELVLALIGGLLAVGFVHQGPLAADTHLIAATRKSRVSTES